MKTKRTMFYSITGALLATMLSSSAAPVPQQIEIAARFLEGEGDPVKDQETFDVLSAPRVTTMERQEALIEMIRETPLDSQISLTPDQRPKITNGVSLRVEGEVVGDEVLLRGTVRISIPDPQGAGDHPQITWASVRTSETVFVMQAKPGEMQAITVPSLRIPKGVVRVEITAKVIEQTNAATVYWKAFAALPPRPKSADEGAVKEWVSGAEKSLRLLHEGVAAPGCDWESDLSKGPALELPHVGKALNLARVAVARAKQNMASDPVSAHADLRAAMALGEGVGVDPLIITQLVRVAIEGMVLEVAEGQVAAMSDEVQAAWREALTQRSPIPSLASLVELEGKMMADFMTKTLNEEGGVALEAMLGPSAKGLNTSEKAVRKLIVGMKDDFAQAARVAQLPAAERKAQFDELVKGWKKNPEVHMLSALAMPSVVKAGEKLEAVTTRVKAFREALGE